MGELLQSPDIAEELNPIVLNPERAVDGLAISYAQLQFTEVNGEPQLALRGFDDIPASAILDGLTLSFDGSWSPVTGPAPEFIFWVYAAKEEEKTYTQIVRLENELPTTVDLTSFVGTGQLSTLQLLLVYWEGLVTEPADEQDAPDLEKPL